MTYGTQLNTGCPTKPDLRLLQFTCTHKKALTPKDAKAIIYMVGLEGLEPSTNGL